MRRRENLEIIYLSAGIISFVLMDTRENGLSEKLSSLDAGERGKVRSYFSKREGP